MAISTVRYREAEPQDRPFLEDMLVLAVNWGPQHTTPREEVLAEPMIRRYLTDWMRPGDDGVLATVDGEPVGAMWWRLFTTRAPSYGFVAGDVPEFALGVVPAWQRQGVGRALLWASYRKMAATADEVSLSVDRDNPARTLYLSEGFRVVGGHDNADTMVRDLR